MKIGIQNLKVRCIIGTVKKEREAEQDLLIDLEMTTGLLKKDCLEHTLDYAALAQFVQEVSRRGFFLLESLAQALLNEIFEVFAVDSVKIKIKKPDAFPHAEYAYVSLEKKRLSHELRSDLRSCQEIGR